MKPGGQRVKGRAFEQKIARILRVIWPDAKRWLQSQGGGKSGGDIEGTPYHIECSKGGESIWAKWKQANEDALHTKKSPVVIKQRDHERPVAMMELDTFLERFDEDKTECTFAKVMEQYLKEFPR